MLPLADGLTLPASADLAGSQGQATGGGEITFTVQPLVEDEHGQWVYGPIVRRDGAAQLGSCRSTSRAVRPRPLVVTWWVDRPGDRRVEIGHLLRLPPERTTAGWTYVDLELDPIRHEDALEVGTTSTRTRCRTAGSVRTSGHRPRDPAQRMADRLRAGESVGVMSGRAARARLHTFTTSEADPDVLCVGVLVLLDHAFGRDTDWQNACSGAGTSS